MSDPIVDLVDFMSGLYEESKQQTALAVRLRRVRKRDKLVVHHYNAGYQKALEDVGHFLDERLESNE